MDQSYEDLSRSRIYKELRRAIIMGHIGPGERLSIEELTARYSTSATPLRDALQMLQSEGLVIIKPRSGYFVTPTTLKELRERFELRHILELAALERAIPRITDAQIDELERVHAGYTGDDDESYDRYTDENRSFHYLLARAAGNDELAGAVGHLLDRLARYMVVRGAGKTQMNTHARIVEALRARDVEEARQALLDELTETREVIMERIIAHDGARWRVGM
jgi:DNA-binding GntR family transcriptional regulator